MATIELKFDDILREELSRVEYRNDRHKFDARNYQLDVHLIVNYKNGSKNYWVKSVYFSDYKDMWRCIAGDILNMGYTPHDTIKSITIAAMVDKTTYNDRDTSSIICGCVTIESVKCNVEFINLERVLGDFPRLNLYKIDPIKELTTKIDEQNALIIEILAKVSFKEDIKQYTALQ